MVIVFVTMIGSAGLNAYWRTTKEVGAHERSHRGAGTRPHPSGRGPVGHPDAGVPRRRGRQGDRARQPGQLRRDRVLPQQRVQEVGRARSEITGGRADGAAPGRPGRHLRRELLARGDRPPRTVLGRAFPAEPAADLRPGEGVRRGLAVPGLSVLRPDRAGFRRRIRDHRRAGRAADEARSRRGRHRHRHGPRRRHPGRALPAGAGRARPAGADRDDRPGGDVHADPFRLADRAPAGHPAIRQPTAVPRHHRAVGHLPLPAVRSERLRAHPRGQ